ncbi:MAG TPA: DUF892 family protein [Chthoniobacteraceae bacterium]|nr:DUF892 family protein [Chthoniobacteraceae bacterium]
MNTKDELMDWLRDAYAMERGLEVSLRKLADSEETPFALREQARLHLHQTEGHAESVKQALEELGSDTSALKTGLAKTMESLKGLGTFFAKDEEIKDVLAANAAEHFEIACYKAIRTGASLLGLTSVEMMCDRILFEEEEMAKWLDEHLPEMVTHYLHREAHA